MLDGWKLVQNLNVPEGRSELELYSHVDDPLNLDDIAADHPDIVVYTAALDRGLDERGYIRPGLGDAGDRIFGTK